MLNRFWAPTITGKVPEGKSGLALDLETLAVHEGDEALDELGLGRGKLLTVGGLLSARSNIIMRTVNSDVAERRGAVVLDIGVGAVEERNKNRNGARVDKLLTVLV